jgi:hypothetical protein
MFHLAYELQCMIMSFLPNGNLQPVSKESQELYLSNVVWKPRVLRRFGEIPSTNYFKEYCWQLQLESHQFCYKRQWTLGCVGRITPLVKPAFVPAVI